MLKFIPTTILQQLCQDSADKVKQLPLSFNSKSVVLVADLRNYYETERFLDVGSHDIHSWNESLASLSHDFLNIFRSHLSLYGGDIIQF